VHRDIKPDNLFCIESGYELFIKVLDFGIAKQSGIANPQVVTGAWDVVGTPAYMSPEQLISTKNVDHKTDLWALTIVAYELLTGDVPYMAETVTGFYDAILHQEPPRLSLRSPALPPALDVWLLRALQRDPDARFANAKALSDAFLTAASGGEHTVLSTAPSRPVHTVASDATTGRPDTTAGVAANAPRRRRRALGWITGAATLAAMLFGGWWLTSKNAASSASAAADASIAIQAAAPATASEPSASSEPAVPEAHSSPPAVSSSAENVVPTDRRPLPNVPPKRAVPPPRSVAPAASSAAPSPTSEPAPTAKPAMCSGAEAFIVDSNGNLVPRPECL